MHAQTDFDSFPFDGRLIQSLREVNILTPTALQRAAFAPLLEGRDLALQAGSGTGRIMAWCLPVLSRLLGRDEPRAVIATPAGDVAMNIESEIKRLTRHVRMRVLMPAAGVERTGASYEMFEGQENLPDILVGTAPSLVHFIDGTGFPLERLGAFVLDMTRPLDRPAEEAVVLLAGRLPEACQRIVVTDGSVESSDEMAARLLRNPAFVIGTGSATGPGEEPPKEPAAPPAPRPRPRRGKARRATPSDSPETWPIAHLGVTAARGITAVDLARVIRVEAQGHTVVLATGEEAAREIERALSSIVRDRAVRYVGERDPLPEQAGSAITVTVEPSRRREDLTANVLVLERFPSTADDYVSHIRMMRCEPGDRIVSMITPRDVSTQYQLRLSYGIRLLERRMPGEEEIDSIEQADSLRPLRDIASNATPTDLDLLARVRTRDCADGILAQGLALLVAKHAERRERPAARKRERRREKPARSAEPLIRSEGALHLERSASRRGGVPMVELELSCGSSDGVEASYLVQWLQSRLAMRVSEIGRIEVREDSTIVTVPRERAGEAATILAGLTFGGRKVYVRNPLGPGQSRS